LVDAASSDLEVTKTDGAPVRFPFCDISGQKSARRHSGWLFSGKASGRNHDPYLRVGWRLVLFFLGFFEAQALESRHEILVPSRHRL
jgi:hypothetical protein